MGNLAREYVHALLSDGPTSGEFRWKVGRGCVRAGEIAGKGTSVHGYRRIGIDRKTYLAHRLAFLLMTGEMPAQVDHDNHAREHNAWGNLNASCNKDNRKNQTIPKDNTSGVCGVSFFSRDGKWAAYINVNRKRINLGRYSTKGDAAAAREAGLLKYKFHANHGAPAQ